jgi:hypothetical protein
MKQRWDEVYEVLRVVRWCQIYPRKTKLPGEAHSAARVVVKLVEGAVSACGNEQLVQILLDGNSR